MTPKFTLEMLWNDLQPLIVACSLPKIDPVSFCTRDLAPVEFAFAPATPETFSLSFPNWLTLKKQTNQKHSYFFIHNFWENVSSLNASYTRVL
jgi:hypothetical protein